MTVRRRKIGVALLGLAVIAVVLVSASRTRSGLDMAFVRYTPDGPALLNITNHENVPLRCSGLNTFLFTAAPPKEFQQSVIVLPGSHTQLLASPTGMGEQIQPLSEPSPFSPLSGPSRFSLPPRTNAVLRCMPQYSKLRQRIDTCLTKLGFTIVNTGFVVSVDLPPR